ncbi:dTDP-4-dehydrorhamnose reductase [Microbulbifer sp. JTAC008]|uniref:dTDP-4-dehydrorhamnose reductase n=1 Tax=unclassified Microbulbifer TaxID=2619833 RepID=UPI00403A5C08
MKILITGKNGQLGRELQDQCPSEYEMIALSREELDISDVDAVNEVIENTRPDLVINSAAFTNVDSAESDPEAAFAVNVKGAENLALICKKFSVRLIHVSTDYVFDGKKSSPYFTSDKVRPLSVYGATKAEAESVISKVLPEAVIVRTSWVYASHSNNFVNTMLRLMEERDQLGVIADQVGTPTWAGTLSKVIFALSQNRNCKGIYHCTDLGVTSWYDFALAIYEEGKVSGLLPANKQVMIKAITAQDYPTAAERPSYSVLDKSRLKNDLGVELKHWREVLRQVFEVKKDSFE